MAEEVRVEGFRFIFWEAMKVLALAFLGLVAAKTVASMPAGESREKVQPLRLLKGVGYLAILALVLLGAWNVGYNVAAESYLWASQDNLEAKRFKEAYVNALRAVEIRPGNLECWRALVTAKIYLHQFASALEDAPALQSLNGGTLDESDAYRLAVCALLRAQYDQVITVTERLIRQNPLYAAPYILQGKAYTAQKKYPEAERSFQAVLRVFPNHQAAVEGLAHVYFLAGYRSQAVAVLDETAQRPFSPEARKHFEALRALYAQ
jgi:tetratricopeptide (TPR) repeat protein